VLPRAYDAFVKINEFSAALDVADELVRLDPANADYRYWRAEAHEGLKDFAHALPDYMNSVELMGDPQTIDGSMFYDISRMYAALGRHCDAITPIETFVSFDPATRRTTQTTSIIAEYAQKGGCDTNFARGTERLSFPGASDVHKLSVVVNDVAGNFILDTGASYLTVTPGFAAKAKIHVDPDSQLLIKTAGGTAASALGYATIVAVGKAEARGVAVAVFRGSEIPSAAESMACSV
jgi:tetratricopeptide (TPR) repeat protein